MSKYPLIESLGLKPYMNCEYTTPNGLQGCRLNAIKADDLEQALAAAPVVYGETDSENNFWNANTQPGLKDKFSARLLCIEKIDQAVTREEIREALGVDKPYYDINVMADVLKRILEHGVKG